MSRALCSCSIVVLALWPMHQAQAQAPLTLAEAMARAAREQPSVLADQLEVDARAAEVAQARRWLNPSTALDTEDLGRAADLAGPTQTTLSVTQRIELGGKLGLRTEAARTDRTIAESDLFVARHELERRAAGAFVRTLAAQAEVALAEQDAATAAETAAAIAARVDAGVAAPPDADRAQADALAATVRVRSARLKLDSARIVLSATWAGTARDAAVLAGSLGVPIIPAAETFEARVDTAPVVQRRRADVTRGRIGIDATRAARVPDLDLTIGYRRLHDAGIHAWGIGVGMSLPLFDRQQDRLAASVLRVTSAERRLDAARASTREVVATSHRTATEAAAMIAAFDGDLIPLHERVYAAVSEGYAAGRFGLLQLLDARRSLIDARRNRLATVQQMYEALVTLYATLGRTDDLAALTADGSSR
jgi:cobalt-zinc-cadmium efflux system outer membrane protein